MRVGIWLLGRPSLTRVAVTRSISPWPAGQGWSGMAPAAGRLAGAYGLAAGPRPHRFGQRLQDGLPEQRLGDDQPVVDAGDDPDISGLLHQRQQHPGGLPEGLGHRVELELLAAERGERMNSRQREEISASSGRTTRCTRSGRAVEVTSALPSAKVNAFSAAGSAGQDPDGGGRGEI